MGSVGQHAPQAGLLNICNWLGLQSVGVPSKDASAESLPRTSTPLGRITMNHDKHSVEFSLEDYVIFGDFNEEMATSSGQLSDCSDFHCLPLLHAAPKSGDLVSFEDLNIKPNEDMCCKGRCRIVIQQAAFKI